MKTIYLDNWLAKMILFGNYTTIMFFGFILSILKEITAADIGNFSPQTIPVGFMEFGFEFIPKN